MIPSNSFLLSFGSLTLSINQYFKEKRAPFRQAQYYLYEKMTLQRLFEVIFDLQGKVRIENGCRNIFIKRNPKQLDIMKKLESALDSINHMGIEATKAAWVTHGDKVKDIVKKEKQSHQ